MTSATTDNSKHEIEFNNGVSTIQVGSEIHLDPWSIGEILVISKWEGAEFGIPSPSYPLFPIFINICIVNRKVRKIARFAAHAVRVQVEVLRGNGTSAFYLGWWALLGSK